MQDPDLEIGWGGDGHRDPEIRGGNLQKICFGPKNKGGGGGPPKASPLDPSQRLWILLERARVRCPFDLLDKGNAGSGAEIG